ncbi:MAG: hypothetical protein ACRCYX_12535 [Dermatophilaceae bacterium]
MNSTETILEVTPEGPGREGLIMRPRTPAGHETAALAEDQPTAPFPGVPTSWDLHGRTLTLYWTTEPAVVVHTEEVDSTDGWTPAAVREVLTAHGVPPLPAPHPASAVLAAATRVGERVTNLIAATARAISSTTSALSHGARS